MPGERLDRLRPTLSVAHQEVQGASDGGAVRCSVCPVNAYAPLIDAERDLAAIGDAKRLIFGRPEKAKVWLLQYSAAMLRWDATPGIVAANRKTS